MTKQTKIDYGFTPSEYQEKIFDFVLHGQGNALINACAGSGKTRTAVTCVRLVRPSDKTLFIAFNKRICEELEEKLQEYYNVHVRTTHSLGRAILSKCFPNERLNVDENKYTTYINTHILKIIRENNIQIQQSHLRGFIRNVIELTKFARLYLAQSSAEILEVAQKYSIPFNLQECAIVEHVLDWGQSNLDTIDYTDMLWLPNEMNLSTRGWQFDWVFFDEAQDASIASVRLFQKCLKRGARFICIGDEHQMINMFAGSSEDAMKAILQIPHTKQFELPLSYRCPKKAVELASTYSPNIKALDDAIDGEIVDEVLIENLREGDMVLSRNNSTLISLFVKLLKRQKNAYVTGAGYASEYIDLLKYSDSEEMYQDFTKGGVFLDLYSYLFSERDRLIKENQISYDAATTSDYITDLYDKIVCLQIISRGFLKKSSVEEHIKKIFSNKEEGICLSTIHKSKGLENDNVYILAHSVLPVRKTGPIWEQIQENNLVYVAYTRCRKKLGFVSEVQVPAMGKNRNAADILKALGEIEKKVCATLGTIPMQHIDVFDIIRLKLSSEIRLDRHQNDNKVILSTNEDDDDSILAELI